MTIDSAAPGRPPGPGSAGNTPGHEGDASAGRRVPAGVDIGEDGIPAGLSFNPFRPPQQRPAPEHWQGQALCREVDPELHFPEKGHSALAAKSVCRECPVQFDCLEYALDEDLSLGVYGGLSENERRPLHRARRALRAGRKSAPVVKVEIPVSERMMEARRENIKKAHEANVKRRAS